MSLVTLADLTSSGRGQAPPPPLKVSNIYLGYSDLVVV